MSNREKYEKLIESINWENWKEDDVPNKYMDLTSVLYSKLDWLKEQLIPSDDLDEQVDTIDSVHLLLDILNEQKIEKILDDN